MANTYEINLTDIKLNWTSPKHRFIAFLPNIWAYEK